MEEYLSQVISVKSLASLQNENKFATQMTEQYSAYQTLAAQAAITQQLRAASDNSQVGGQMG